MNISVKYKERHGGAEAEVWLTATHPDILGQDMLGQPEAHAIVHNHTAMLSDMAKKFVRRQLCDCGCSHDEKDCCP